MKFKILGMALLALAATSALVVTNASGTPAGNFQHHNPNGNSAIVTAHEAKATAPHQLKFYGLVDGSHATKSDPPIECEKATYEGTVSAKTVTEITLTPTYTNCNTEGAATGTVKVHVNGCGYRFFSQGARQHGTVEVHCPPGKAIVITHPNCEITVPAQTTANTLTEGIAYTNQGNGTITAHVTVNTITGHYHGGLCIFLGTSHKFEMKGSVTVKATDHNGNPVTITSN